MDEWIPVMPAWFLELYWKHFCACGPFIYYVCCELSLSYSPSILSHPLVFNCLVTLAPTLTDDHDGKCVGEGGSVTVLQVLSVSPCTKPPFILQLVRKLASGKPGMWLIRVTVLFFFVCPCTQLARIEPDRKVAPVEHHRLSGPIFLAHLQKCHPLYLNCYCLSYCNRPFTKQTNK